MIPYVATLDDSGWPDDGLGDRAAYGLSVAGDHYFPMYRAGDVLVCSPQAEVAAGDRVVVYTEADVDGIFVGDCLADNTDILIAGRRLQRSEVAAVHRVVAVLS